MHLTSHQGDTLTKVQYLSIVPETVKYRLVYLKDKDGKVRDFNADEYDEFLNDFHGSLFVKWEQQKSDTIENIELNLAEKIKEYKKSKKPYEDKLKLMMIKYDSTINEYYEKLKLEQDSKFQKQIEIIEKYKKLRNSIKEEIKTQTDKNKITTLKLKLDSINNKIKFKENSIDRQKIYSISQVLDSSFAFAEKRGSNIKTYFITNIDAGNIGGATSPKSGFGALFKADLWNCNNTDACKKCGTYKVCIHEFAHFLTIIDAGPTAVNKDHPDKQYLLYEEKDYDNIMYYKILEQLCKIVDKRWFLYQVKRAHKYLH